MSNNLYFPIGCCVTIKKGYSRSPWYSIEEYMVTDYGKSSQGECVLILDRDLPKNYGDNILPSKVELSVRYTRHTKLSKILDDI
jgi:hypothetical protein